MYKYISEKNSNVQSVQQSALKYK